MHYQPSVIYTRPIPFLADRLGESIALGCSRYQGQQPIALFFRADDIGVPSRRFNEMIQLFQRFQLPLALAVVPSWLTRKRYQNLRTTTGADDRLWCWHMHGRKHHNHEATGRKQEFGPSRDKGSILADLLNGRDRLQAILGNSFSPYFTPPWNRCSRETAVALRELGFLAISRAAGAQPAVSDLLPDFQVNVDLHTGKAGDPETGVAKLLQSLTESLAAGRCGIMLHHQRMNRHAFILLELLLGMLSCQTQIVPASFDQLLVNALK